MVNIDFLFSWDILYIHHRYGVCQQAKFVYGLMLLHWYFVYGLLLVILLIQFYRFAPFLVHVVYINLQCYASHSLLLLYLPHHLGCITTGYTLESIHLQHGRNGQCKWAPRPSNLLRIKKNLQIKIWFIYSQVGGTSQFESNVWPPITGKDKTTSIKRDQNQGFSHFLPFAKF